MMGFIALFGLVVLVYLYGGYAWTLGFLSRLRRVSAPLCDADADLPAVTVLITVFNEEGNILARIQNALACDYPSDRVQVIVASDGSTDETDTLVNALDDKRVILFRPGERRGKTDTQNQAMKLATGEVVIFTDADTRFDHDFLVEIVKPFADAGVGGADGHLLFSTDASSGVSQSQGFYWGQELKIRSYESRLGVLAVASGACMAVRRTVFRPMLASVGEDCLIPLDVVAQGYRLVHAERALAFDKMEHDVGREFRTRVRMTLRNWQGTWSYPQLLNPFRQPGIALALWSHKVLRWLSPLFLSLWILPSLYVLFVHGEGWGLPAMAFVLLALVGAVSNLLGIRMPAASSAFSFFLANVGFLFGVLRAFTGKKIISYR